MPNVPCRQPQHCGVSNHKAGSSAARMCMWAPIGGAPRSAVGSAPQSASAPKKVMAVVERRPSRYDTVGEMSGPVSQLPDGAYDEGIVPYSVDVSRETITLSMRGSTTKSRAQIEVPWEGKPGMWKVKLPDTGTEHTLYIASMDHNDPDHVDIELDEVGGYTIDKDGGIHGAGT